MIDVQKEAEATLRAWIGDQAEAARERAAQQEPGTCRNCISSAETCKRSGLQIPTCPATCPRRKADPPGIDEPPGRAEICERLRRKQELDDARRRLADLIAKGESKITIEAQRARVTALEGPQAPTPEPQRKTKQRRWRR